MTVPADSLFPTWRGRQPFSSRLAAVSEALARRYPQLAKATEELHFEEFSAATYRTDTPVWKYNRVPDRARARVLALPAELRSPWLCALLLWHMGRFEKAFAASGLHEEFALHYTDAFHRILDQIEARPEFADLSSDSFRKDLWLTRVVMVPAFAQVWWPYSGLATRDVLRGGLSGLAYVFLRCGGRRPFLEGHTHDPVAKAYWNEPGWREALRLAALALPAFPRARGVFSIAWYYDPAVKDVSPRIRFAQDLQVGKGSFRIKVGSNAGAISNATATSETRRKAYSEGSYLPTDYAIVWSRRTLCEAYETARPAFSFNNASEPFR